VVIAEVDIDIEVECAYSGEMQRSTCTFTATSGEGTVESLTVPWDLLCATVVGGDFEEIAFDALTQPEGNGLKSTRQEEGSAVVTIELDGEMTTAATATYWCETDRDEFVPVTGPGVRCESASQTTAGASNTTGTVVVHAFTCAMEGAAADTDWFDTCQLPTAQATFQLERLDGEVVGDGAQSTDASGVCRFGELPAGIYRLEQTGDSWCHAESNSVDAQGNVIVDAAEIADVWIFHCAAAE
jgi:hypothetical protein